jgi:nitrogenase molybdenum-iron protein alpha/beta subunit
MNKLRNLVPPLATDYSGACSALFPMNSLNLLYSPGGCSSTILECDEPRDMLQTLFFSSKLRELDAVMGAEEEFLFYAQKLYEKNSRIEFMTIIGTPLSALTGVDITAMAGKLSGRIHLPVVPLPLMEGFEEYYAGVHHTLMTLGKYFWEKHEKNSRQVNVIGYTPLSLGGEAHIIELVNELTKNGIEVNCPSIGKFSIDSFKNMTSAALNIVVSHEGIGLAQFMQKEYNIPYVANVPIGLRGMQLLFQTLETVMGVCLDGTGQSLMKAKELSSQRAVVIAEPLFAVSLASCMKHDFGIDCAAASLMKFNKRMKLIYQDKVLEGLHFFAAEDELAKWVGEIKPDIVVGDPLYQELLQKLDVEYVPIPHVGLSGALYASSDYHFVGKKGYDFLSTFIEK